ncbi:MAG: right-handed parallel beta-helix repeat-containing protein [Candidatus Zixiibacteriota bacterium]|nr:MAG: right-handed parallel beta-helix repeat-containing protein [candidate division Zixibacteria bacterium]
MIKFLRVVALTIIMFSFTGITHAEPIFLRGTLDGPVVTIPECECHEVYMPAYALLNCNGGAYYYPLVANMVSLEGFVGQEISGYGHFITCGIARCSVINVLDISVQDCPAGNTWYVLPDGSGDAANIQAAIMAATDGDIILVADGVFSGLGNTDIDFLGKNVEVASENGPEFTIIDCSPGDTTGHRGFILKNGEGPTAVIDGLTIEKAVTPEMGGGGGGVICNGSSPTIRNCIFRGNHAGWSGGAIYCSQNSSPTITDCRFEQNKAMGHGGAVFASASTAELTDCLFDSNGAWFGGGAISCQGASVEVYNCTFNANFSQGGAIEVLASFAGIDNSIIAFTDDGSAVYCWDSSDIFINCTDVYGNEGGDWVGAIAGLLGNNNLSADPLFCGEANPDEPFTLYAHSPCAPENNPECDLIGVFDVGCTAECVPGDADGMNGINILDASYIVSYLYKNGPLPVPYEVCSGDPDATCLVDLQDVSYIISYLYKNGPAPVTSEEWSAECAP